MFVIYYSMVKTKKDRVKKDRTKRIERAKLTLRRAERALQQTKKRKAKKDKPTKKNRKARKKIFSGALGKGQPTGEEIKGWIKPIIPHKGHVQFAKPLVDYHIPRADAHPVNPSHICHTCGQPIKDVSHIVNPVEVLPSAPPAAEVLPSAPPATEVLPSAPPAGMVDDREQTEQKKQLKPTVLGVKYPEDTDNPELWKKMNKDKYTKCVADCNKNFGKEIYKGEHIKCITDCNKNFPV